MRDVTIVHRFQTLFGGPAASLPVSLQELRLEGFYHLLDPQAWIGQAYWTGDPVNLNLLPLTKQSNLTHYNSLDILLTKF